jgi:hypothetical protein
MVGRLLTTWSASDVLRTSIWLQLARTSTHLGGGEVRIQNRHGHRRDSDTVAPGHDPHPHRQEALDIGSIPLWQKFAAPRESTVARPGTADQSRTDLTALFESAATTTYD